MSRAAEIAAQATARGVKAAVPLLVTPGSEQVRATIARDGQMQSLKDIGATVLANACGPCIGQWRRSRAAANAPNTIVTSYNRNFPRRNDGQPTTMNFIASPELVTAFALAGRLSFNPMQDTLTGSDGQPFKLVTRAPRPKSRRKTSRRDERPISPRTKTAATSRSGSTPTASGSSAWSHGRPGTAAIFSTCRFCSRAGENHDRSHLARRPMASFPRSPRQIQRQHVHGRDQCLHRQGRPRQDVLSGEADQSFAKIARDYKSRGVRWVVVGDFNYGEGSSREHAALSPRLLGGAAVIARSFARIHESNLKKQGLLALTFQNPDDYEHIREDDRIDLVGVADLSPGRTVTCIVRHADGTTQTLALAHSFSGAQLKWFQAGSALNSSFMR